MLYDAVTRPAIDRAVALVFLAVKHHLRLPTALPHRHSNQRLQEQQQQQQEHEQQQQDQQQRRRLFVWAGLDFIVSADGRPWLLEANVKPAGRFLDAAAQFPSEPVAAMARAAYAGLAQLVEAENGHNNHNDDNDDDDMSNGDDAASSGGQHQGEMRWLKLDIPALLRA